VCELDRAWAERGDDGWGRQGGDKGTRGDMR